MGGRDAGARRPDAVTLAVISGLGLGLGLTVLLQQFAVWTLTFTTLIVIPVLVALDAGLVVWALRRRRGGR